jgi:adenylate cyclase
VAAAQLDPFLIPFARTARIGAIALSLAAVIVTVLAIIVTGKLTRSLEQLASAADRVSLGDLDARIDMASGDEVGRVARAFNEMIANVRRDDARALAA